MAEDKLKLALVGVGYWGKNLARIFSKLGALGVICDSDAERLKQARIGYPAVRRVADYADILKDKSINAVAISTPAESHYRLAKEAILAGKDVFVEKPLSLKLEEGMELVGLADKHRRVLMVGHLLEYHPAVNKLKALIGSGELGEIQYICSNRLNLGKIRREENILWSFAPHDISVILMLLGELPESVSAYGGNFLHRDIADVTVSNFNFSSGIKGHIFVSWLHPYKEHKLIIVGKKGMALFDDLADSAKLQIFKHRINWVNSIPVPEKAHPILVKIKAEEPLLLECMHFLDCLKSRKKPKTDGRNGLRVLRVLQACQASLEKGGLPMPLDSPSGTKCNSKNYYVHPSSLVEEPCFIGNGTKIWHYSHIMKGAHIGKDCVIGQNVFIGSNARVGNGVKIQNNVSLYDCVRLEDGVFCGPSVVFTNVINPRSHISRKNEFKDTRVGKAATLGANSTIICGNSIGEYAFIGAGAVVTKNVPDFALVYGNPAVIKGWVCSCAEKLEFIKSKASCKACGKKYAMSNGLVRLLK